MQSTIQVIVGLGNPGAEYDKTRHNAGAWFVERLAESSATPLLAEKKLHGLACQVHINHRSCRLLLPTTFMNHSGQAVRAMADFYKLKPENFLIVHDELDLPAGTIKFKKGGGHGGHNGLRDIIAHLGTQDFLRLRVGIGHPGDKKHVLDYVLGRPSKSDHQQIDYAIDDALSVLPMILDGKIEQAMQALHT